jgi:hypothetical protein
LKRKKGDILIDNMAGGVIWRSWERVGKRTLYFIM